ncbi:T9SS type A sorting domain-containing protein [Pseudoflavitalea sp. X16]|uniref:T9SS type A sorting domain-containing protein n=1 Tax=Paraflavitalea devenefica TaxID=2716334 RepID=UPI00142077CA|nr:T9SS type A sorting domain-containing protein [Paraflavitalea devenefica]NII28477.1 T9SS type A sorting domain-containing protein [Paraflavitalea devenefica]
MKTFFKSAMLSHVRTHRSVKTLLLAIAASFYLFPASAQSYYPGGLGNTNLIVWLNAANTSSVTLTGGTNVRRWSDLSGRSYHFVQNTNARRPVYYATGGPNSKPAIRFTASNDHYLSTPSIPNTISYTAGVSSFTVVNFSATSGGGYERIYDFGVGESDNCIWFGRHGTSSNIAYEGRTNGTLVQTYTNTTSIIANGTHQMQEVIQQGGTAGTTSPVTYYRAGTAWTSGGTYGSITYVPAAANRGSNYIGRSNWAADEYYNGYMSEILFYNIFMNTTRRIILENYLSASWGITVANSRYTTPAVGDYGTNLVGIGYTSASDHFLTDVNGSTDGLGFSSGATASDFLNTAGYVMAAHDGQTNSVNSSINISGIGNNLYKWNRSWNIQKTGGNSTGNISIRFNFSDYNGSSPNSTYSYALLYNATDGSFTSGTNQLKGNNDVITGDIVSFSVNAANLPAGYYTLVWSTSAVLPVELTSFTATPKNNSSLLQWSTAQETNSSHFEVQRSVDGTTYSTIGQVAARGNSTAVSWYSFTDPNPIAGRNYYRLKIIDNKGAVNYSAIRVVDREGAAAAPEVYLTASGSSLHINGLTATGMVTVRMFNAAGQLVKRVQQPATPVMDIAMELPGGWYMAEISSADKTYRKKIIKQ